MISLDVLSWSDEISLILGLKTCQDIPFIKQSLNSSNSERNEEEL